MASRAPSCSYPCHGDYDFGQQVPYLALTVASTGNVSAMLRFSFFSHSPRHALVLVLCTPSIRYPARSTGSAAPHVAELGRSWSRLDRSRVRSFFCVSSFLCLSPESTASPSCPDELPFACDFAHSPPSFLGPLNAVLDARCKVTVPQLTLTAARTTRFFQTARRSFGISIVPFFKFTFAAASCTSSSTPAPRRPMARGPTIPIRTKTEHADTVENTHTQIARKPHHDVTVQERA